MAGVRRRDRRGRGVRGPLAPRRAPVSRTRAERFEDLVDDEVRRLHLRWGRELAGVAFTVEDVPSVEPLFDGPVPLGQTVLAPPPGGRPPDAARPAVPAPAEGDPAVRIVVFRRPVEARATGDAEMSLLIRDLLVEEVADLLGLSPESVDPSYDSPDD
ncbi:metallopeptidase family protein [Actinomadura sp. GC306]|uniref:metallopeptidase family protein n=1 Tax=Actinomadura sp. GC306 TaxID=2530367 RepID=UPI00104EA1FB|nr:metallopeptidase family protein [Actinomadura sp. GC306]TDC70117.1 metallopeptidase family protein [Actinomadura sp. GC306]